MTTAGLPLEPFRKLIGEVTEQWLDGFNGDWDSVDIEDLNEELVDTILDFLLDYLP